MKVLILTNHLSDYAGSEMQVLEIYEYFKMKNNIVHVFSNIFDEPISQHFNINDVYLDIDEIAIENYDLVWSQHAIFSRLFKNTKIDNLKIKVLSVHLSPYEMFELSSLTYMKQIKASFVANSEETLDKLITFGINREQVIISYNSAPSCFIQKNFSKELKKVAIISNHPPQELLEATEILRGSQIQVDYFGISHQFQRITPKTIEQYDVIITIGKSVQYAILSQKPVYCYDYFGGCGYLDDINFSKARYYNFSGRGFTRKSAEEIAGEIIKNYDDAVNFVKSINDIEVFYLENLMKNILENTLPINLDKEQIQQIRLSYPSEEKLAQLFKFFINYKTRIILSEQHIQNLLNNEKQLKKNSEHLTAEINALTTRNKTLSQNLSNLIEHNHVLETKLHQFKKLWLIKLLKPFIKLEQGLHSLNRYRKAFRLLMREKGSFGKAYQTVRRYYKANNIQLTKKYLKDVLNGQFTPYNPIQSNTQDKNWDIFDITNNEAYQLWIKRNDTLDEDKILSIKQQIQSFKNLPKISILMPVYNVDVRYLVEAINSILNQIYTNWELCISDDASPNQDIRPILEKYQKQDSRIKVILRESNGHISENSNSALTLATGEWLALMDHDDVLPIHALFEIAKTVQNHPSAQLIYSDEDKIDGNNHRFMPHFKSDFNLDLLYSQNYISHLGVYKTTIAKDIGGFRKGFEGSQDYDFLLRYLLKIDIKNIIHIPKILYHWRAIEGSTALAAGEKSYTTEAGILALTEHFKSLNKEVTVSRSKVDNTYRIKWHLSRKPLVSLIIPTKNGYDITKQAIDSILNKTTYQNYEIVLVDNNSDDPKALEYFLELEKHPKIQVLHYPYPFNYSAINNFAAQYANGEVIGLINNDIEVINNEWLDEMVSQAMRPDIGCVGAMLYYPNNTIQHAGVIIGIGGVAGHSHKQYPKNHHGYFSRLYLTQNLMAVTAACLLVRKEIFENVKGLNEKDLAVAFNDVDFCLKVHKAGYRNLWTPFAELYHHESISRGTEDNPEKIARFNKEVDYMIATWQTNQVSDPYYNPNLSLITEDFAITMQSRIDILD